MPPLGQVWKWALAVAVLAAIGWLLWFSWRGGTFLDTLNYPFGGQGSTPPPTEEEVIDSLSAPSKTETTVSSTPPAASLESLSPAASAPQTKASSEDNPTVDSSVLDSLSAPN